MQGLLQFLLNPPWNLRLQTGALPLEYRTWSKQREMHFHPQEETATALYLTKALKADPTAFTFKDKETEVQVRKVTCRAFQRHQVEGAGLESRFVGPKTRVLPTKLSPSSEKYHLRSAAKASVNHSVLGPLWLTERTLIQEKQQVGRLSGRCIHHCPGIYTQEPGRRHYSLITRSLLSPQAIGPTHEKSLSLTPLPK